MTVYLSLSFLYLPFSLSLVGVIFLTEVLHDGNEP